MNSHDELINFFYDDKKNQQYQPTCILDDLPTQNMNIEINDDSSIFDLDVERVTHYK